MVSAQLRLWGAPHKRKGMDGLAMLVEGVLKEDPFSGHLFAFRGRKANLIKIVFWDGNGLCLFSKRLDQGGFIWPQVDDRGGKVVRSSAPLSLLIEGIDWRTPQRVGGEWKSVGVGKRGTIRVEQVGGS